MSLLCRHCLSSLAGYRVVVVDDGSRDSDIVERCANDHGASVQRITANQGPGHARNVGASVTTRKYLWFVDVDVSLDDADRVARHLEGRFQRPAVSRPSPRAFAGQMVPRCANTFESHFGPLDMGSRSSLVVPGGAVGLRAERMSDGASRRFW